MTMCATHEHAARWRRRQFRRFGNRDEWLARLEEYQRDLEQELADVADIIRRLKEEAPRAAKEEVAL
jgi:hypothetical protein